MGSADRAVGEDPREVAGGVTRTSRLSGCKGYDAAAEKPVDVAHGLRVVWNSMHLSLGLPPRPRARLMASFPAHRGPNNHRVRSSFFRSNDTGIAKDRPRMRWKHYRIFSLACILPLSESTVEICTTHLTDMPLHASRGTLSTPMCVARQ